MDEKVINNHKNNDEGDDDDDENNKKVVLITGCARGGIGYEYCRAFAELGCHVVATDLPERLPGLSDLPGEALPLDVTSDESVAAATRRVLAAHGRVDVLLNNAGVGCTGPLAELSLAAVRRAWEVNALGQLRLVRAVAPHMAARRSGRVVNVGSVVGRVATPWAGAYCAAKAAAHAATDALRLELRPFGVHVIKVVPGAVRSNLGHANTAHLEKARWDLYRGFEGAIEERARASQVGRATDARIFARHVARLVMRARPPREIVYGHMTGLFAALAWSPVWVRDRFFAKRFGLDKTV
ncbi:NADPH-dependent 1-acyldihydroxyacetone phosphate reductase [Ananas comosus]|uniref:NADPH-dependent 1-acyldihydroxyacetone phosphate reductase n=1 Tax=Ananas comosus TaxID=4615 RepID=A0A199VPN3_ANACO|nr:NADPH-dependent 1-acyldihydroxyacetone phosphate reductase [Ananas comosus]